MSAKLASIEQCLQQRATLSSKDCLLDDSLQEMLAMMEPIEEGVAEGDWLADRTNEEGGGRGAREKEPITCDSQSDNTTAFK